MELTIHLDESGQLTNNRRQIFVIGGFYYIENGNKKQKTNINLKNKSILKSLKKMIYGNDIRDWPVEVKGRDLRMDQRQYVFGKLDNVDIELCAIVFDKFKLSNRQRQIYIENENQTYAFLVKCWLLEVLSSLQNDGYEIDKVSLYLDMRTTKNCNQNFLEEYLNMYFKFETNFLVTVECKYMDSKKSYSIQIADIIANTIYGKYFEAHSNDLPIGFRKYLDRKFHIYEFPNSSDSN